MKRTCLFAVLIASTLGLFASSDPVESGFQNPPPQTKPWVYWYWISDHISRDGITRDLESMARVGIGEAFIGNIFLDDVPAGKVKVLTDEWWSLVEHAIREGGRLGVDIGMFNCPGWSQSGGPWIQPGQSMRSLAWSELELKGPAHFSGLLPAPSTNFQDVALLAFPAADGPGDSMRNASPEIVCVPAVTNATMLADGDVGTAITLPGEAGRGKSPFTIEYRVARPFTARALEVTPAEEAFGADAELQVSDESGAWRTVRRFACDRSNMSRGVGFMPRGPVCVAFPETTGTAFRLVFTGAHGDKHLRIAEIDLLAEPRLESYVEKQLGKMHPTPLPSWNTYLWPTQQEPQGKGLTLRPDDVRDLRQNLRPDGTLTWDVPPGRWRVLRFGMSPTGMRNSPASPEGQGLEVDKMNSTLARRHFDAFIGEILRRMPAKDRTALKHVVADSYEMGSQNWTDGLDAQFRRRYGYDPKPWLPVLTGRLVRSADQSERFLWDLRRLVADRVATDYVGGLREACHEQGLQLWLENYGHWGFPSEFLKYGGASDRVGGEYWVTGDLGSIELRAASSCANIYGKPFVSAESFTGGPPFQNAPAALKARGDWAFSEGVNHFVLHVTIHQPSEDKVPGMNAWFGTEFNRHNTWFERSKPWIDYVRRCCWVLQQGTRVADVAYFIGEDAPKMTGVREPVLPQGCDFDYINAEVIQERLVVKDGWLTLPHGTRYRLLVLPDQDTMRPELLRKIGDLVRAGATVVGRRPLRSPSLQGYPKADSQLRRLAESLWGSEALPASGERLVGKGRIVWGQPLSVILASHGLGPDFESSTPLRFTHRRTPHADFYFVANPRNEPVTTTAAFRAGSRSPELWWPDAGRIDTPAVHDIAGGTVRLPLALGPHGSVIVAFRKPALPPEERVVSVSRAGQEILGTTIVTPPAVEAASASNTFTFAAWVSPTDSTTLVTETNRGVIGLAEKRNDAIVAPHGDSYGGGGHAGCGLAVGTNGVCVFEHGANYFAPTLVHPTALANWTHVTVVYADGQPTLFLNGQRARTGQRSEHVVHPGASGGANGQFRGQLGAFKSFSRALGETEVAELAHAMPRPDRGNQGPGIEINRQGASWAAMVSTVGDYSLRTGTGKERLVHAGSGVDSLRLDGPWEVRFTAAAGGLDRITLPELGSWTEHTNAAVRHYSGTAVYRKAFDWSHASSADARRTRVMLDLGQVRDLATVRVNGHDCGTLWMAPWSVDITTAIRAGNNELEVEVVNVWNNRLVGDAALPDAQRDTFLFASTVKRDSPLLPAGLLGPVVLRTAVAISVK